MKSNPAYLELKVSTRASRTAVLGWHGNALKVTVNEVPERGRANAAVESMLAETLDIAISRVHVVAGRTSTRKRVAINGLSEAELRQRLHEQLLTG